MKYLEQCIRLLFTLSLTFGVLAGAWWLVTQRPASVSAEKLPPAASVSKTVKEEDLNTILLTEEAEKRIGLSIAPVEKKSVRRVRAYGGEVVIPVGKTIFVASPLVGTLKAPESGELKPGQFIKAGKPVFMLIPLLTPDGRATLSASLADTEGQVNNAKAQLELTKIALDRAKRVLKEGAGSQRQVDEAQAAYSVASKTLDAASARLSILKSAVGDVESGTAIPHPLVAPSDGILRTISAGPGQTVHNGAPLFEVVDLSAVWIRVQVPVGDLESIDREMPAQVGSLSVHADRRVVSARPVNAPPSANALSATVDVFYELPNHDGKLTPGQRLGVAIPLTDAKESLAVPWSALVFDIHGGTWVYVQDSPHKYSRRRAVVAYTMGNDAILSSGLSVGTKIVVTGVQELFGAETGFVK